MGIYAALGIPEVWRFDGETLTCQVLRRGAYVQSAKSAALPALPLAEVVRFLRLSDTKDETTWIRSFRAWVRRHVVPAAKPRKRRRPQQRKAGSSGSSIFL